MKSYSGTLLGWKNAKRFYSTKTQRLPDLISNRIQSSNGKALLPRKHVIFPPPPPPPSENPLTPPPSIYSTGRGAPLLYGVTDTILWPFGPLGNCTTYSKCWFGLLSCGNANKKKIEGLMGKASCHMSTTHATSTPLHLYQTSRLHHRQIRPSLCDSTRNITATTAR